MANPSQVARLAEVMRRLRAECPWDAEQTHASLVSYLVEETCEVVEAIEGRRGPDSEPDAVADVDLREELGDVLLQVIFHATIAAERGAFDLDDVAAGVADKLISRHPHVFAGADVPDDLNAMWERRKRLEKGRRFALDGIPTRLSALARAHKVLSRAHSHGVLPEEAGDAAPIPAETIGAELLALVRRAQAEGVDAEQALRRELRALEAQIAAREA